MPVNRPVVLSFERKGRQVEVQLVGPDYITLVDGAELPNFQLTPAAGMEAAERWIDEQEREKQRKTANA